jgi:putative SOS response-associated peptidase YedK
MDRCPRGLSDDRLAYGLNQDQQTGEQIMKRYHAPGAPLTDEEMERASEASNAACNEATYTIKAALRAAVQRGRIRLVPDWVSLEIARAAMRAAREEAAEWQAERDQAYEAIGGEYGVVASTQPPNNNVV